MPSFSVPVNIDFEFTLICDACGAALDYTEKQDSYGDYVYEIVLCDCVKDLITEGFSKGYDEGNKEGYSEGHIDGYKDGQESTII